MMASTVEVLCPNGRRQNVKITANSKLLQILEEVCQKQGFDATDYDLRHGRKTLDLSLAFRYAGLPNNSKLEMVQAERARTEAEVHLALDMLAVDGSCQRLQDQFFPSMTLWDVLLHYQREKSRELMHTDSTKQPPEQLVCNYMSEEVVGESALKATTLKSLGLTGGRAVIRLRKRRVEAAEMAELEARLQQEQARLRRLEAVGRQRRQEAAASSTSISAADGAQSHTNQPQTAAPTTEQDHSAICQEHRQQLQHPAAVDADAPSSSGSRQPLGGQGGSQQQTASQAVRALRAQGLEVYTPDDFTQLSPHQQQVARQHMRELMAQMGLAGAGMSSLVDRVSDSPSQPVFQDFKFPEETKGKALYQNDLCDYQPEDYQPCVRETLVFNSEDHLPHTDNRDNEISDDFFELTDEDVKRRHASLQRQLTELQGEALMTQTMRQQQMERIYEKYPRIVIRIVFPDKLVLQGLFRPRETVHALEKFVQENLKEKSIVFELYTTPPKRVLTDKTLSMIQAHLVPASNVYFKSSTPRDHYLAEHLLNSVKSRLEAETSLCNLFPGTSHKEVVREVKHTGQGKRSSGSSSGSVERAPARSQPPGDHKAKEGVPKWLKLGKS